MGKELKVEGEREERGRRTTEGIEGFGVGGLKLIGGERLRFFRVKEGGGLGGRRCSGRVWRKGCSEERRDFHTCSGRAEVKGREQRVCGGRGGENGGTRGGGSTVKIWGVEGEKERIGRNVDCLPKALALKFVYITFFFCLIFKL